MAMQVVQKVFKACLKILQIPELLILQAGCSPSSCDEVGLLELFIQPARLSGLKQSQESRLGEVR